MIITLNTVSDFAGHLQEVGVQRVLLSGMLLGSIPGCSGSLYSEMGQRLFSASLEEVAPIAWLLLGLVQGTRSSL